MLLSINNTYLTSLIAYRQHSCLHFEIFDVTSPYASCLLSVSQFGTLESWAHPSGRHDCLEAVCDLRLPHDRRARALAGLPLRKGSPATSLLFKCLASTPARRRPFR